MNASFENQVREYINLRRSLGCRLDGQSKILLDFGRFLDRIKHCGPITTEVALRWAEPPKSKDPSALARRLGTIRGFLRHRAGFDQATEIPPAHLFGCYIRRKPPHIYIASELEELLNACTRLRPRDGLRSHTYVTLFSLLLCSGLRISEALHLEVHDVDLKTGILTVRNSKFGKSRLVPLHASALPPLRRYAALREDVAPTPTSFFRTDYDTFLTYSAVRMTFKALRIRLGWTSAGRARLPRIMDMRHSFAVGCLVRWYREDISPDQKIAHLATYLGHTEVRDTYWYLSEVRDTYWYLSVVPELSTLASERFERFAMNVKEVTS